MSTIIDEDVIECEVKKKIALFNLVSAIGFSFLIGFGIRALWYGQFITGIIDISIGGFLIVLIVALWKTRQEQNRHLKESQENLSQSRENLRMLLSSINDIVLTIDLEGRLVKLFKPYSKSSFPVLPEELEGEIYSDVLPEEMSKHLEKSIQEVKQSGKSVEFDYSIGTNKAKSWFIAKVSHMKNEADETTGYTVVARDMTDRHEIQSELERMKDDLRLSEQSAILGRVAASIAHEINNPASAIQSDINVMKQILGRLPDSEGKQKIQEIMRRDEMAIERVTSITTAMRGAYRPAAWHWVDLNEEIGFQLTLLHVDYKNRIEIKQSLSTLPKIRVYGSEIGQVLLNVLKNAIDSIPQKGEITIETSDCVEYIKVLVRDTGDGIPSDVLPHIFEPFYTTKAPGKGTGLGLSTSHQSIEKHGGRLFVQESIPGQGTTMVLELPKKGKE